MLINAPILVTGATGNVGLPLVLALLAAGHAVRALVTNPEAAKALFVKAGHTSDVSNALQIVRFDFADPSTYSAAFLGGQALFLLRPPPISDVKGLINPALDAAVQAGVRRVAFLSVPAAEKNALIPHYAIEQHLKTLAETIPGFSYTFLRAAFFMQNLSTTHAADIRDLDEIIIPAGKGRSAFVDARDLAEVAKTVLTNRGHENAAYELTGDVLLTYADIAAILTRVLGRPIAYNHPGIIRFYRHMRQLGHIRAMVLVMLAFYVGTRFEIGARTTPALTQLLGRAPISFEQFAQDFKSSWLH